jgi:hypothetical protein
MTSIKTLQAEIEKLKDRNSKVEADKAWETSLFRKAMISALTYATVVIFFFAAELPDPFVNAIVPSLAFLLSTLTLPFFKRMWIGSFYKGRSGKR